MMESFDDAASQAEIYKDIPSSLAAVHVKLNRTIETDEEQNDRLEKLERTEVERTGAAKLTSKLVSVFGGTILAAIVGLGGLLWNANGEQVRRGLLIEHIIEKQAAHRRMPHAAHPVEPADVVEVDRRVDGVARETQALRGDVDRNAGDIRAHHNGRRR